MFSNNIKKELKQEKEEEEEELLEKPSKKIKLNELNEIEIIENNTKKSINLLIQFKKLEETEEENKLRFMMELEFIQCLSNPYYLNCLYIFL